MPEPKIIVLISAVAEWRAVRALLPQIEPQSSPLGEWFVTDLDLGERREPVVFFHGGWGKIAAAASTQYVIDRWSPALLVNLGTCGGFEGEIERGTTILVERTIVYDIVEQMTDPQAAIAYYATELDLSWLREPYPQPVRRTLLMSGDRDLIVEDIPQLKAQYGAIAGDWESGAIAWVAARNNTRCIILRGVTDLVGASGGEAYNGNKHVFDENARTIMGQLVKALPAWLARALGAPVAKVGKIENVTLYTDGACIGNPGPGGYGVVLLHEGQRKELSGGFRLTTNNRMEIMAAIVGLQTLKSRCAVTLYSDSRYLVESMTQGWAKQWRANHWRRGKRGKALNSDLWEPLLDLCDQHEEVEFVWVQGHAGNRENERCDQLSMQAAQRRDLPTDTAYEENASRNALTLFD